MGVRAIIFGELKFPPRQAAVWRGLSADPSDHVWPDFFQGDEQASTVVEVFDACALLNDVAGPSFFFLAESPENVRVRAWLDEEHFEPWIKRLGAAFKAAHSLAANGEVVLVDADDRRGVRLTMGADLHLEDILLSDDAEDHYAQELAEVFELSRGKLFGPSAVWIAAAPQSEPILGGTPVLPGLDFVEDQLFVSYRGSLEPQDLIISLETADSFSSAAARTCVATLVNAIALGTGGGAHFSPSVGLAEALEGLPDHEEQAYELLLHLRVAGVAPRFLRFIVEHLRTLGKINLMAINGSLPLDGTELSVQETQVGAWLASPSAYLEEWSRPGFEIMERTAAPPIFTLTFASAPPPKARAQLEAVVLTWIALVTPCVSEAGEVADLRGVDLSSLFRWRDHAVSVIPRDFPFARRLSRAVLINMLTHFHETVEPLESVDLGFP